MCRRVLAAEPNNSHALLLMGNTKLAKVMCAFENSCSRTKHHFIGTAAMCACACACEFAAFICVHLRLFLWAFTCMYTCFCVRIDC